VAISDPETTFPAMRKLDLVVHIATKLNRSHLIPAKQAFLLPCLGRTELDLQNGVVQSVTVEDSMSMVHASQGGLKPASGHLLMTFVNFFLILVLGGPMGEEFGWRGYAQARIAALHGPVKGALLLGLVWAAWHLFMMFSPVDGHFDVVTAVGTIIELPLYSVLFAWFLRRTRGGLAVAIALHMGAHLDNVTHTPDDELRIRVLRVLVLLIAVAFAARSLTREDRG